MKGSYLRLASGEDGSNLSLLPGSDTSSHPDHTPYLLKIAPIMFSDWRLLHMRVSWLTPYATPEIAHASALRRARLPAATLSDDTCWGIDQRWMAEGTRQACSLQRAAVIAKYRMLKR